MANGDYKIIRDALLLDIETRICEGTDILVEGDEIRKIGAPGADAPEGPETVDASGKLVMAGLVNVHTHGLGNLGKGLGDNMSEPSASA
jgi:5-methylthioadenosine/S-adenosylhomocysteine deaminase